MASGRNTATTTLAAPRPTPMSEKYPAKHAGHLGARIAPKVASAASQGGRGRPRGGCWGAHAGHSEVIAIPVFHPRHRPRGGLVAAFGHEIEVVVRGVHHLDAPSVGR